MPFHDALASGWRTDPPACPAEIHRIVQPKLLPEPGDRQRSPAYCDRSVTSSARRHKMTTQSVPI